MTMKLLLRTFPEGAGYGNDYDLGNLECAVLDVTADLVRRIEDLLRMSRKIAQADQDLAEVRFHDATPCFYGYELISACEDRGGGDWFDAFHDEEVAILTDGIDLAQFEVQPTEGERIELCLWRHHPAGTPDHEISWIARRNNCEIAVHTAGLTLDHPLFLEATKEADATQ
jgi:hypothetical protein